MGDRIAVLDAGELQQVGTPLECYHEPANLFVAGFIGEPSMNFFETEFQGDRLVSDTFEFPLDEDVTTQLEGTHNVTLGIRPEDIDLTADPGSATVIATVQVVEPMGDRTLLHLDVAEQSVTAIMEERVEVSEGTEIGLTFPPDSIHLFDTETGETIINRTVETGTLPDVFDSQVEGVGGA